MHEVRGNLSPAVISLLRGQVDHAAQRFWQTFGVACRYTQQDGADDCTHGERSKLVRKHHLPDVQHGV